MLPPLLSPLSLRGLLFVETLENAGHPPTKYELRSFLEAAQPEPSVFSVVILSGRVSGEASLLYLMQSGLIYETGDTVRLSAAGSAILRSEGGRTNTVQLTRMDEPLEVAGRLTDPFTYGQLLSEIQKVDDALIVDPYLPSSEFMTLVKLGNVSRFLTKRARIAGVAKEEADDRTKQLQIHLGASREAGIDVEIRYLGNGNERELHDRVVLPRTGQALLLGTSLGGRQFTVLTRTSDEIASLARQHYEGLWSIAKALDPIGRGSTTPTDVAKPR